MAILVQVVQVVQHKKAITFRYGKKRKGFLLYCSRLFVTLASPKFLALGNAKEKQVFLLHFTRYFVTLPRNVKT